MNPARGGGRGNPSGHFPVFSGKHDRYCVWCGGVIPRQNQLKTVMCPHAGCRRQLPLRGGTWIQRNNTGMGRCPVCDSFVHKVFMYCQVCKCPNDEGLTRRNMADAKQLSEEREKNKGLQQELDRMKRQRCEQVNMSGAGGFLPGPGAAQIPLPSGSAGSIGGFVSGAGASQVLPPSCSSGSIGEFMSGAGASQVLPPSCSSGSIGEIDVGAGAVGLSSEGGSSSGRGAGGGDASSDAMGMELDLNSDDLLGLDDDL